MEMVNWISEIISNSFWQGMAGGIETLLNFTFDFISQVVIQPTEPGKYLLNFNEYLKGAQLVAGSLLVVSVVWSVFRQISGVMYDSEISMGTYFIHITFAGG